MSKPIFIVKCPHFMQIEDLERVAEQLSTQLTDYHVFCYKARVKEFVFECFLATKADKERIEKLINELNERKD